MKTLGIADLGGVYPDKESAWETVDSITNGNAKSMNFVVVRDAIIPIVSDLWCLDLTLRVVFTNRSPWHNKYVHE